MLTEALLLRATDYRDADRILTLFTRATGKLSAIARGARGSKRRFSGALEPYAVVRVGLTDPRRGDLYTLKSADLVQAFPGILTDLARMDVAGAALALVRDAHAPHVPDPSLFTAAVRYLTVVDHEGDPQRSLLLAYALYVLTLMGVSPRLEICGRSGAAVPPERPAYFDPDLGAVVSQRLGGGPYLLSAALRARLVACEGEQWLERGRGAWEEADLHVARSALAAFMRAHLPGDAAARLFPAE